MTSVLAKVPELKPTTKFSVISTPVYYENEVSSYIPIPFTVENNVMDINNWSSSVASLISSGYYAGYLPGIDETNYDAADTLVKVMGGLSKVVSLGPNLMTYLENMVQYAEDASFTPNIQLVIPPVMTRIQASADSDEYNQPLNNYSAINFHPSEPSGDGYIFSGDASNDYLGSWVFKTAMTISYQYEGNTKYATLTTNFGNNLNI